MQEMNKDEFSGILQDIRIAYRLLALYQTRIKDIIVFVMDKYSLGFEAGYSKFSNLTSDGKKVVLTNWSWDWLPMYLYQFSAKMFEKNGDKYFFHIFHQADTGFYDKFGESRDETRLKITEFGSAEEARTRLFFVLGKNNGDSPYTNLLADNLGKSTHDLIKNDTWLAMPYGLAEFYDEECTIEVIKDFSDKCLEHFKFKML